MNHCDKSIQVQHTGRGSIGRRPVLICLTIFLIALVARPNYFAEAKWFFQPDGTSSQALNETSADQHQIQQQQQLSFGQTEASEAASVPSQTGLSYGSYGSSLLSIAGIQPSSIASVLNTVGDTGFKYFNIHDQCRNRAACDLGYMLFKRLSFVHNWLIRTSVRTLTDMNNIYTQSWMDGMMGKNCTAVYTACRQSPLEGIMNLALLQRMVL